MNDTIDAIDVLDTLQTGIVRVDMQAMICQVNVGAENLLGRSRARLLGQGLDRIFSKQAVRDHIASIYTSLETLTIRECELVHSQQEYVRVDCIGNPVFQDNKMVGLVLELSSLETQIRSTREEQLIRQQETTQSFLRGLAHEIKNPLGGLRGAAQLLDEELTDEAQKEYTQIIIAEADRLQALVNRMLGARKPNHKVQVNIHQLLEHVRKLVTVNLPEKVDIKFDYDPSIPDIKLDKDKIIQLILNLMGNAITAVGDEGLVVLRTRIVRNKTINQTRYRIVLKLDVIDNGPGVPAEIRDTLFFPLVSGSPKGSGLGLSIAQTIANQHDGIIEYVSDIRQSCFSVLLPLEDEAEVTDKVQDKDSEVRHA